MLLPVLLEDTEWKVIYKNHPLSLNKVENYSGNMEGATLGFSASRHHESRGRPHHADAVVVFVQYLMLLDFKTALFCCFFILEIPC